MGAAGEVSGNSGATFRMDITPVDVVRPQPPLLSAEELEAAYPPMVLRDAPLSPTSTAAEAYAANISREPAPEGYVRVDANVPWSTALLRIARHELRSDLPEGESSKTIAESQVQDKAAKICGLNSARCDMSLMNVRPIVEGNPNYLQEGWLFKVDASAPDIDDPSFKKSPAKTAIAAQPQAPTLKPEPKGEHTTPRGTSPAQEGDAGAKKSGGTRNQESATGSGTAASATAAAQSLPAASPAKVKPIPLSPDAEAFLDAEFPNPSLDEKGQPQAAKEGKSNPTTTSAHVAVAAKQALPVLTVADWPIRPGIHTPPNLSALPAVNLTADVPSNNHALQTQIKRDFLESKTLLLLASAPAATPSDVQRRTAQHQQAFQKLNSAYQNVPTQSAASRTVVKLAAGDVALRGGLPDMARKAYQSAAAIDATTVGDASLHLALMERLYAVGDKQTAAIELKQARELTPKEARASTEAPFRAIISKLPAMS